MRYLIDTNIIVYMISDPDLLDKDVKELIAEPDALLYASAESAKELVVAYRNKGLFSKRWKSPEDMLRSIEDEHYIQFLPTKMEHIYTYSRMEINERQCHKDPSDHLIQQKVNKDAPTQGFFFLSPIIASVSKYKMARR